MKTILPIASTVCADSIVGTGLPLHRGAAVFVGALPQSQYSHHSLSALITLSVPQCSTISVPSSLSQCLSASVFRLDADNTAVVLSLQQICFRLCLYNV